MLLLSGYDLVLCSDLCPRYLWRELTFCRYDSESLPERLKLCSVNRHFSCFSIIIRHFCWLHCLFLHLSLSEDLQQHLFLAVVKSGRTGMLPQSCNLLVLICFSLLFSSFFLYFSKHLFFFFFCSQSCTLVLFLTMLLLFLSSDGKSIDHKDASKLMILKHFIK